MPPTLVLRVLLSHGLPVELRQLGETTGGVWTTTAARDAGLRPGQVRHKLATGEWQRLRRGVLCDGGVQPDGVGRAWAAVLAAGGPSRAVAAGRTAARLHGLPLVDDADPLLPPARRGWSHDDVLVGRTLQDRPDLHVHRARVRRRDLVVHPGGLVSLTPLRTLVDLARLLPHDALVCALDDALRRRLVALEHLRSEVDARPGARGTARLRAAVEAADGRAESPNETLARLLLRPVLPGLVPQVRVRGRTTDVLARLDLGDVRLRFGVEADGGQWHRGELMLAKDRARERLLADEGWVLERVTWTDLRRDPAVTLRRVLAAARRHEAVRARLA